MNEQTTHALTPDKVEALLTTLRTRFEQQMHRHAGITWQVVQPSRWNHLASCTNQITNATAKVVDTV